MRSVASLVVFTILAGSPSVVEAHAFHFTVTTAEFNEKTGNLEVSVRVSPDDLEKALRSLAGGKVDLDSDEERLDKLIVSYLESRLSFKSPDGKKQKLRWVGKEVNLKSAWLHFEVPLPGGLRGAEIQNRMFLEHFPKQVNTMNFREGRRRWSFSFSREKTTRTIPVPKGRE
jgi:hypothetical protein